MILEFINGQLMLTVQQWSEVGYPDSWAYKLVEAMIEGLPIPPKYTGKYDTERRMLVAPPVGPMPAWVNDHINGAAAVPTPNADGVASVPRYVISIEGLMRLAHDYEPGYWVRAGDYDKLLSAYRDLDSDHAEIIKFRDTLANERQSLLKTNRDLQEQCDKAHNEYKQLRDVLNKACNETNDLRAQLHTLKWQHGNQAATIKEKLDTIETAEQVIKDLQETEAELRTALLDTGVKLGEATARVQELESMSPCIGAIDGETGLDLPVGNERAVFECTFEWAREQGGMMETYLKAYPINGNGYIKIVTTD